MIIPETGKIIMNAGENSRQMSYKFKLPENMSSGLHSGELVVMQVPSSTGDGAYLGAALGVITQIYVYVPYPGKYVDIGLDVMKVGGGHIAVVPVVSRGKLDIESVKVNFDLYKNGGKINSSYSSEEKLESGKRTEISSKLEGLQEGNYKLVANVIYDGEIKRVEKEFFVGADELEIQDLRVNDFSLGGIAKFEMLVENKLDRKIEDAYANTEVFNSNGEVMAEFKSADYDFEPLGKKVVMSYWDTDGVKKGEYDASVALNYGDNSIRKDLKIRVYDDKIDILGLGYIISERKTGEVSVTTILLVAIGVLIVINAAWFVFIRRRFVRNAKVIKVEKKEGEDGE